MDSAPNGLLVVKHAIRYEDGDDANTQQLLALLGGLRSLDLLGSTELGGDESVSSKMEKCNIRHTFLARFFRSFRSLREGLSTLVARPD